MQLSLIAHDDVFPLARALAVGIDRPELRRLTRQGRVHRLHHGWFSTREPADDEDRHRLRLAALLQQYASRAVASDASALLLLGLPTYEPDWAVAHLMRTGPTGAKRTKAHRKPDLVVRPCLDDEHAARLPATERAVHPAVAIALAGLTDPCAFLVPADAALRERRVTVDELRLAAEVIGRRPGIERVRAAVQRCDARHESPGETVAASVLHRLGFRTVPQFVVPGTEPFTPGGRGYRADAGIVGTKVLVEFDGRSKYASPQDLWEESVARTGSALSDGRWSGSRGPTCSTPSESERWWRRPCVALRRPAPLEGSVGESAMRLRARDQRWFRRHVAGPKPGRPILHRSRGRSGVA